MATIDLGSVAENNKVRRSFGAVFKIYSNSLNPLSNVISLIEKIKLDFFVSGAGAGAGVGGSAPTDAVAGGSDVLWGIFTIYN